MTKNELLRNFWSSLKKKRDIKAKGQVTKKQTQTSLSTTALMDGG